MRRGEAHEVLRMDWVKTVIFINVLTYSWIAYMYGRWAWFGYMYAEWSPAYRWSMVGYLLLVMGLVVIASVGLIMRKNWARRLSLLFNLIMGINFVSGLVWLLASFVHSINPVQVVAGVVLLALSIALRSKRLIDYFTIRS